MGGLFISDEYQHIPTYTLNTTKYPKHISATEYMHLHPPKLIESSCSSLHHPFKKLVQVSNTTVPHGVIRTPDATGATDRIDYLLQHECMNAHILQTVRLK